MNALLVVTRFAHLLATIVMFGGLAFVVIVAIPAMRADAQGKALAWDRVWRRIYSLVRWSLAVSAVSAIAWLVLEAAVASGSPLAGLLKDDTIARVATQTLFGRVWTMRILIAISLIGWLVADARAALCRLIDAYDVPDRCYLSQPQPGFAPRFSDYAQLARVAEWAAAGDEG